MYAVFWGFVAALAIAYVFIKSDEGDVTLETTLDFLGFNKGSRLNTTEVSPDGISGVRNLENKIVPIAPSVLIAEAEAIVGVALDPDIYALARSGRSEGRNGMEARMHVMVTQAEQSGMSILERTVSQPGSPKNGYFGTQKGRRWASSRDPYEGDIALANKVLQDRSNGIDPTGGAGRFVDKSAFGKQEGTRTFDEVLAEWTNDGYSAYRYPGASSDFVLFRRGEVPEGFESA